jgi:Domain of unknown function (DUF4082)
VDQRRHPAGGRHLHRESVSEWRQVNLASPVAVTAGTTYVASYHTDAGHSSVDEDYFTTSGVDSDPLNALANGVYAYGPSALPTKTYRSSNYWVDAVFTTTAP